MHATDEIIAQNRSKGRYDFTRETNLIRRGKNVVLIHDEWSAKNIAGEMYRPVTYQVPQDRVGEVAAAIDNDGEES